MRKLIIIVVVVLGVGGIADVSARAWAQGQIESRVRAEVPSQVGVSVHIHALPFIPPLLLSGRLSEADGHFTNVPAGPLVLSAVDIELHGVRFDRHKLINERKAEIVAISDGTVRIELTAATLSGFLHVPVQIANGEVKAGIAGVTIGVRVSVQGNALLLGAAGVTLRVPIPRTRVVPCVDDVTVLAGRVRLSCTIHDVPPALLKAAQSG